jgi:hypothetical protein
MPGGAQPNAAAKAKPKPQPQPQPKSKPQSPADYDTVEIQPPPAKKKSPARAYPEAAPQSERKPLVERAPAMPEVSDEYETPAPRTTPNSSSRRRTPVVSDEGGETRRSPLVEVESPPKLKTSEKVLPPSKDLADDDAPVTSSRRTVRKIEPETPRVARSLPPTVDATPAPKPLQPVDAERGPIAITDEPVHQTKPAPLTLPGNNAPPVEIDQTPKSTRRLMLGEQGPSPLRPPAKPIERVAEKVPTVASRNDRQIMMTPKSPVLSVETVGPRRITMGKESPYVVKLRNTGDQEANDVVVFVTVPPWAEVIEARGSVGTTGIAADKPELGLQWRVNQLAPLSEQELSLKIIPRRSQPFDVNVRWTYMPPAMQSTVEVQEPKLQMAITGPAEVPFGEQRVYKLTISNPGNGDAEDVVIHLLPITPQDGGTASHRLGTLKAGSSTSVEIELTARQAGRLAIRAEATADAGLTATAQNEVLVRRPVLAATITSPKMHYAGAPIPCELRVRNTGDAVARNVTISLPLPPGADLHSVSEGGQPQRRSGYLVWIIDELPAGNERVITFKCTLKTPGENRLEALVAAEGDLRVLASTSTRIMAVADLVLEVADMPGPLPVTEDMVYTVRVRNRGSSSAQEIEVVAYFSAGVEPASVEGGLHEIGPGRVLFRPISSLAAGGEQIYRIKARATASGNHKMRVELACRALGTQLTQELTTLFYSEEETSSPREPGPGYPSTGTQQDGRGQFIGGQSSGAQPSTSPVPANPFGGGPLQPLPTP